MGGVGEGETARPGDRERVRVGDVGCGRWNCDPPSSQTIWTMARQACGLRPIGAYTPEGRRNKKVKGSTGEEETGVIRGKFL